MRIRFIHLTIIIVGLLLSFGLAHNLYTAYQNSKVLSGDNSSLTHLQIENSKLKTEIVNASSPSFIDKLAREKLGLTKPGEVVLILPSTSSAAKAIGGSKTSATSNTQHPIWKQWRHLLLGV